MPTRPCRWMLTGGIGSGKSEAARILSELGAFVLDADRIGHEVLEPGGEAFAAVAAEWPEVVVEGRIDRRALGRIVFADRDALRRLESITHPRIAARIAARVEQRDPDELVVVELSVPAQLLLGAWITVVVDTPDPIRIERLRARGMDDDEIDQRMAAQPSREEWAASADVVVDNSGSLEHLRRRLEELVEQWCPSG